MIGGQVESAAALAVEVGSIPARVVGQFPRPTSPPSPGRDVLGIDGSAALETLPPALAGVRAQGGGEWRTRGASAPIYLHPALQDLA